MQTEIESLRNELNTATAIMQRATRRARVLSGLALLVVTGAIGVSTLRPVGAQGSYGTTLTSLQAQVNILMNRTQYMSADSGAKTTTFSGCNVMVQSGSGYTDDHDMLRGLGNLIIGYNSNSYSLPHNGSHNLIVGDFQSYSGYGGIVAGYDNAISGAYASVVGGWANSASGMCSAILGGYRNSAQNLEATVSGGEFNISSGVSSSVVGGDNNVASGIEASVLGGYENNAAGWDSTISGGAFCYTGGNHNGGDFNSILGGFAISNTTLYGHTP